MIEDKILSICLIILSISLIPQIYSNIRDKMCSIRLTASIPSTIALLGSCGCFISLNLYFSASINILASICWMIFIVQRTETLKKLKISQRNKKSNK